MSTPTLTVADAFGMLHMDLYRHLDEAEFLALTCHEWTEDDVNTMRRLIPDLVFVVRGLLLGHQMWPDGDCRSCRAVWPCPVVALIHGLIKDPQCQYIPLVRKVQHTD